MRLVDDPAHRFWYPPAECRGCGADLSGQEIFAQRRHQVTDIKPAPPPEVTEHVAQSKMCPCCGTVSEGELPASVRARAGYGPEAHAQAALLTCGNYIPVGRAAELMAQLARLRASAGWTAGVRAKAAALVDSSGFMDLVAGLLRQAEAVHADETPARAAGGLRYVHLACTRWLTHMHTGDRSAPAVDAGGVLPGYTGIIVRDGYHGGYGHLTGRAARLVRRPSPARPAGPLPVRAGEAGLGGADGRPPHRSPRRRPRRPRRGEEGPGPGRRRQA